MRGPPGRLRSGYPYGLPSFDPPRCPAPHAGICHRPVQHASVSPRRRPGDLVLRAVPCLRHSQPADGSRCLRPGGPVRCAAPSRQSSRPAAGSLRLLMQGRVLPISSSRSYRHPSRSPVSAGASCNRYRAGIPPFAVLFSSTWPIRLCRLPGRSLSPDPCPSRAHALRCRHSSPPYEGRVSGATIIKWLFCRPKRQKTVDSGRIVQRQERDFQGVRT